MLEVTILGHSLIIRQLTEIEQTRSFEDLWLTLNNDGYFISARFTPQAADERMTVRRLATALRLLNDHLPGRLV
jgi:hypothetical protein